MRGFAWIAFIFALAGCQADTERDFMLLNLSSSGEVRLIPDMASMSATISCTDKNIDRSTDCAKRGINALFQLLEQNGIKREDYHSSRIELEKEHTWRNDSYIFKGYKSSSTISILFRDLDAMAQVITGAMTMKEVELSGLDYSHSQIDALSQQAYLNALDNGRQLAEKIREKLGGTSMEIIEVNNTRSDFVTQVSEIKLEQYAATATSRSRDNVSPIQINPGELTLQKELNVLYKVYR